MAATGAGKTLAGFLPTICELAEEPVEGLHTLYVSPLKALAVDVQRNLIGPIEEMGLPIRVETRTGDTPADRRRRQAQPEQAGQLRAQRTVLGLLRVQGGGNRPQAGVAADGDDHGPPRAGQHVAAWRHPDAYANSGTSFAEAADVARTAERGKFDLLFLADSAAVSVFGSAESR